jgi:ABC-type transport system involved in cytochrome c biogenesis permease subunit
MSTTPHKPGEFGEPPTRTGTARGPAYYAFKAVKALASLQLTVVLFALGMMLIFFGTIAQLDFGIWTVVDKYFWSWVVDVPFDLFAKFLSVFWKEWVPAGTHWPGTFPFPAGKLIGGLMLVNLLAAHAVRFRLTWKRSGVLLIHGGLILLFVGEFITREYAVEQRMTIDQGQSANYTEDTRHVELAFIDKADPKYDTVSVIPQKLLKNPKGRITHPDLPVDVEVVEFMANSKLEAAKSGTRNPADRGIGTVALARAQGEVSGVDPNQKADLPAVYVKLYKKGSDEALGTYLASLLGGFKFGPDELDLDGKKIDMTLRFKRYNKPFRVHLDKFSFDRYTGTQKAKNYSSDVRVIGADGSEFPYRIAMNEPLRYNGETFYQADFDKETEKTTILQVVKNPGWLLPYISCAVVGFGLALHFMIYLVQFLRRGAPRSAPAGAPADAPGATAPVSAVVRYFPWVVVGVMALYLLGIPSRMNPPREPFNLDTVGRIPVVEGGRVKLLDTAARVHLRMISGREEVEFKDVKDGNRKKTIPAIQWYMEMISSGDPQSDAPVWNYPIFRIDNESLLRQLQLADKDPKKFEVRDGFRWSMNELAPHVELIRGWYAELEQKVERGGKLDTDETKKHELGNRLFSVLEMTAGGGPLLLPHDGKDWGSLKQVRDRAMRDGAVKGRAVARAKIVPRLDKFAADDEELLFSKLGIKPGELKPDERARARTKMLDLLRADPEQLTPEMRRTWLNLVLALLPVEDADAVRTTTQADFERQMATHPAAAHWEKMLAAYRDKKHSEFNAAVEEYRTKFASGVPDVNTPTNFLERVVYTPFNAIGRNKTEIVYNRFAPFYQCSGLYVFVFILTIVGFTQQAAGRPHWAFALRRAAVLTLLLTLAVHTVALLARMYITERAGVFVTNLYSSAVFIGLGGVVLGLVLETIFKMGVGNMLAATLGLATCIVAHNIAADDSMEMMQAVLDTNFWLATHVTTITLGYAATLFAGYLGMLYVQQLLAAVVRDSYRNTGEPTVGELLAFGVAATGSVALPLFQLWFFAAAMDKYEFVPSFLLWSAFGIALVLGVIYALGLMLLRVSSEGVDENGKPLAGRVPGLANPLVAMALTPERSKVFGQMVYGVVCFATLLSFVGTVLGGIWADQSWGRFWGWDPKENGAVLIVLWNSLILHARWAGLVKDRGVAVLAIFGNVITAWSWFGTNQLGIGLHAYGFDSRLADACFNFWVSQLMILALGLIPSRFWASATRRSPALAIAAAAPAPTDSPPAPKADAAPTAAPAATQTGSPNVVTPPQPNGNGHTNGKQNGQPRRDKGKKNKRK